MPTSSSRSGWKPVSDVTVCFTDCSIFATSGVVVEVEVEVEVEVDGFGESFCRFLGGSATTSWEAELAIIGTLKFSLLSSFTTSYGNINLTRNKVSWTCALQFVLRQRI
jgi:hypothetical protein